MAVEPFGCADCAAQGLDSKAVSRDVSIRPVLTVSADGALNNLGVPDAYRRVIDAEPCSHAGTKPFHEYVVCLA